MKFGIFALKDFNKSKDLPKFRMAAHKLGIDVVFVNPKDIYVKISNGKAGVFHKNGDELNIDAAINWIPYAKYDEISYAFKYMNIPYINTIEAVRNCRNKVLTNIILSNYDFVQPKTLYYPHMVSSKEINISMDLPFIYKRKNGSHGMGAQRFNSSEELYNFLNEKYSSDSLYFQEYIKNNGYDYRILAVGDKVVGGIKKHYKLGEWRTHVAHGGKVETFDVPEEMKNLCIKILKALGLSFAGIDIMTDINGKVYILEVNSVPGMNIFYNLTGINMAEKILLQLKELLN